MAEEQSNPNPQPQQAEEREVVVEQQQEEEPRRRAPKLRYLDFVQVAAAQAAVCLAALYGLAKDHAGPLHPGVDAVESAVKGVVGPFCGLPLDVLAFVDPKVDNTVHEVGKHLPGALKAASARAYAVARELAAEAQQSGVKAAARAALAKAEPAARDLYVRYEPAAERLAVSAWRSLNGLPVFSHVAQIVVPTAAHWAEKYNRVVATAADHGYAGAKYLPTIPTERIAKVFSSRTEAESK